MRLAFRSNDLLAALKRVGATKRTSLPILSFVRVAPDGPGAVRLTSSDMETEISVCMECDYDGYDGDYPFLLPASKAAAWTALQMKDAIVILTDGDNSTIKMRCDRSSVRVSVLDDADFPLFSAQPPVCTVTLPGDALNGLLDSVAFAAAVRDVRYYLNGVLLEISGDRLTVAATDGHRIAIAEYPLPGAAFDPVQAIIPIAAVEKLLKLSDDGVTLSLLSSEQTAQPSLLSVTQQSTGFELVTKLIDGKYPDYRSVIPTEEVGAATLEHDALTPAVRQAMVCSNEEHRGLKLTLATPEPTGKNGKYYVSGSTDGNESSAEFEFESSGSPPLAIGLNGAYLLDALAASGGGIVTLSFSDHEGRSPMTMTTSGRGGWLCVISPMRV